MSFKVIQNNKKVTNLYTITEYKNLLHTSQ